jgi:methanethiol S-methyltransferase
MAPLPTRSAGQPVAEPAPRASVMPSMHEPIHPRRHAFWGLLYVWSAVAAMWAFWISFVVFLVSSRWLAPTWPLPMVDRGGLFGMGAWQAGLVDVALIALFGIQHSVMARPWFKQHVMSSMPPAFERGTYVHLANATLFALVIFWQPIPIAVWSLRGWPLEQAIWVLFAMGWATLLLGAWSYGIGDLLGLAQMRAWANGREHRQRLRTGRLYRWLRHPMYVGVLLGVWATPRMSLGHLLLALGLTAYVLVAMRYEERDLIAAYGGRYLAWRTARS